MLLLVDGTNIVMRYASAMAECETLLGLKPLTTRIRGTK